MILYINTTLDQKIKLALKKGDDVVFEKIFDAPYQQAEKLLPEIDKLLKKAKIDLKDIESIEVENRGGSFTSLRIGVITANALGYALGIPVLPSDLKSKKLNSSQSFDIIKPEYNEEPNITKKKAKI